MSRPATAFDPQKAIQRQARFAAALLLVLVVVLGGLAASVSIGGAVIAPGQVMVASDVKRIQHPTGGVVSAISVKEGVRVKAGDILLTLDSTATGANARIIDDALNELTAKEARLEAERDSRALPLFGAQAQSTEPSAHSSIRDEARLFEIRLHARQNAKAQLVDQKVQIEKQIVGFQDLSKSKTEQIALIDSELAGLRRLFAQDLVPLARLNALQREAVQLRGDVAQLSASVAEAKGKLSELDVQIIQTDQTARAEAGTQLSEVQGQLAELRQKKVTAQQELKRIDIRAPQDGVVDRLIVHTVGGVIAPGETLMFIVPDKDQFSVEAHIKPTDVDKVSAGQKVMLRFSAFDVRTTPEIGGQISRVSAEAQTDEKSGASFYTIGIKVDPDQISKHQMKLVPGMPVESFIQTDRRTILSYLTKPLVDQLRRAFRE